MRVSGGALALLACLASRGLSQRLPARTPIMEEGAFELVTTGMVPAPITVLVSPRGAYLLPLRAVLEPLGIPLAIVRDSLLARVARPAGIGIATVSWRPGAAALWVTGRVAMDSTDWVARDDDLYLAAPRMAQLIESVVDVDLATLTVRVQRDSGFPAQRIAGVRERRREQVRRDQRDAAASSRAAVPFIPRTGFGVVEWAVGGPLAPLGTPTTVETRAGMGLYGGILKTGTLLTLPGQGQRLGAGGGEASYQRVFPDGALLRQVQLGDIVSGGALARSMRGVALTNAPYLRSQRFGEVPFSRPLPPGWEYEVYEGDRLVGYADATTHTALNVPVQYGMTPLRVRLYGPAGETVESTVSYVIPVDQLPDGDWQYALGGGRCTAGQCSGMAYGDVRRGVTRNLTVQAGVDETQDSVSRTVRPYGGVSFIPAAGWTTLLQARQHAFLRGAVQKFGDGKVSGSASLGMNAAGEGGIGVANETDGAVFAQTALQLRHVLEPLGERTLTLATRVERPQHGGRGRWDVTSYLPLDRGVLETGVQSSPLARLPDASTTPIVRIAPTLTLSRGRLRRLGAPVLRVEAGFQAARLAQWDVGLALQPGRGSVNLSVRQLLGMPGAQLTLGGSVALGGARALSRLSARSGAVQGAYSAAGAVAFGEVRRAMPLDYGGLGLAGVEGRVFRDRDGDGRFSAGDEPVGDATVEIGGLRTRTDAAGRYAMWNALPYEALDVQLDSLSLEDPSWVSAVALHALRPSPQQFTRVDFPLVHTREVIGRLEGRDGMSMGGIALELRGERSGLLYETRTFSDGGFYLSRVRPGRYRLTLAGASERALRASLASPPIVEVPPTGDEVVEVPALRLLPAVQVPGTVR